MLSTGGSHGNADGKSDGGVSMCSVPHFPAPSQCGSGASAGQKPERLCSSGEAELSFHGRGPAGSPPAPGTTKAPQLSVPFPACCSCTLSTPQPEMQFICSVYFASSHRPSVRSWSKQQQKAPSVSSVGSVWEEWDACFSLGCHGQLRDSQFQKLGEICSDDGSFQPHLSQLISLCCAAFLLISVSLISPPNSLSLPISSPVPQLGTSCGGVIRHLSAEA